MIFWNGVKFPCKSHYLQINAKEYTYFEQFSFTSNIMQMYLGPSTETRDVMSFHTSTILLYTVLHSTEEVSLTGQSNSIQVNLRQIGYERELFKVCHHLPLREKCSAIEGKQYTTVLFAPGAIYNHGQ